MSKLLSIITLPISILVILKYFKIYDIGEVINFDIVLIGAILLVAVQVFSYITVSKYNEGTTLMGKIIKTILAIPGILYIINLFYPIIAFGFDLEIIVALFLFTESIYGLH